MDSVPDFTTLSTEQLLAPVGVPLVTLVETYKLLIALSLEGEIDRPEAYRLATALLAVITASYGAAETG